MYKVKSAQSENGIRESDQPVVKPLLWSYS